MLSDYFDIDSLISLLKKASLFSGFDEKMVGGMNGLLNVLFSIGKSIVEAGNFLLDKIYTVDILNSSIDHAFNSGNAVWESLFKTFGTFFIMLVFAYGVKDMMRHGLEKIYLRLLIFSGLFILGAGFFSSGGHILKEVNTISTNAQTQLVSTMAPNVSKPAEKLVNELGLTEPDDVTGQVQNMLYYKFTVEPFLLMNFGTTDVSTKQISDFTAKNGEYTESNGKTIDGRVDTTSEKNPYMTGKKLGQKFAILVNAGIDYVIVAGIILVIAVLNFLVQIFILMLVLLSPIFLARALLPDNEHVMFNVGKMMLGAFAVKVILGVGFGFIFMLLGWIESAFGASSFTSVIAGLFVKVILAVLIYKNYHWFKSVLTQGKISALPKFGKQKQHVDSLSTKSTTKNSQQTDKAIPEAVKAPLRSQEAFQNDYGDNVILQSAMAEPSPRKMERIAKGLGYLNERGVAGSLKDGVSTAYQESNVSNRMDKVKQFNPKEAVNERVSALKDSYHEGQFEAFDKHGLVNSPDVPVDSMRVSEGEGPTRETPSKESNHQEMLSKKEYRRTSSVSPATESFDKRLARLRGEPMVYDVDFKENQTKPTHWDQSFSYETEEALKNDSVIQAELRPKKDKNKTTESL